MKHLTDTYEQEKPKGGMNPVVAVITGAVVGVGVAVAGAVALQDKHNREKIKEVLSNVKNQAIGYVESMQKTADEKKDEVAKKLTKGKKGVKKMVGTTKVKKITQKK